MSAPDRQQLDELLARVARAGLGPEAERLRAAIAHEREVMRGVIRMFMRSDRESRQRIAELEALGPTVDRARDLARTWRQYGGHQMRTAARLLDEALAGDNAKERRQAEHLPAGSNAEDCSACAGSNPPYPFLCPGTTPKEPTR
ncbi:hypothetical protein [Streptomyces sp. NRRL F-5630]|uniref:hypothetical protein n=1 Tax=Streptomyces sp. NRRL F-5630 TaxID=1463864 RepID=UPI003D752237